MEQTMTNDVDVTDVPDLNEKNVIGYNPVFPIMTASVKLDMPDQELSDDILKLAGDRVNDIVGFTTARETVNLDVFSGITKLKEALYGVSVTLGRELKFEANYDKCAITVWASVVRDGNYSLPAGHRRNVFAGVYFVGAGTGDNPLVVLNPTNLYREHEPVVGPTDLTAFTAPSFAIKPEVGTLHVWPAWLQYCFPQVKTETPIVCLFFSVDFLPLGA